jgi:hypothetical protein
MLKHSSLYRADFGGNDVSLFAEREPDDLRFH